MQELDTPSGLSGQRLAALHARELEQFIARTGRSAALLERGRRSMIKGVPMSWMWGLYRHPPIFVESGRGPLFWDVDGNAYLDFNVVDLALTMGFGAEPIAAAVGEAARRGAHFLLPIEESIDVAEKLAALTAVPFWQFTLSASGANAEVLRIARSLTRRDKLLIFEGHYHGHLDDALVERDAHGVRPAMCGLPAGIEERTCVVPFNDLTALEAALSRRDIALVLTEPALSNCTLVLPQPGYLQAVHELCQRHGSLFCLDEAHTFQFAHGGLKRAWQLPCDALVLGKGLGTGVPFGLYGLTERVAEFVEANTYRDLGAPGIAAGGTTYANTLAILAAQAALDHFLTPENFRRVEQLGGQLASGLARIFEDLGLQWTALSLGPRAGYGLLPRAPRNGTEAFESMHLPFISARKLWMANRGIWDAMASAGPQVSFSHEPKDVEKYLEHARGFLQEVIA
jgi:glutamate-1-semialdehyde 2,1-aminomutase